MIDCEWGLRGLDLLRPRAAALIIVDVLSFSTAVDVALGRGGRVVPFAYGDAVAAQAEAEKRGALLAYPRRARGGQFSLSPASLMRIDPGALLVLPSPNGSRLSLAAGEAPILAGCLRNASAVARVAREMAGEGEIGVIPAGERWPDGSLRPAIEDWLGAGAIIDALDGAMTPEARLARDAWRVARNDLASILRASRSGRELIDAGFSEDVEIALAHDVSRVAPLLREGIYDDGSNGE